MKIPMTPAFVPTIASSRSSKAHLEFAMRLALTTTGVCRVYKAGSQVSVTKRLQLLRRHLHRQAPERGVQEAMTAAEIGFQRIGNGLL